MTGIVAIPVDADLPTNVDREDQLSSLPEECRSNRLDRPLRHIDAQGNESTYVLKPIRVVWLILIVEAMERFAYYGVYYTQTLYLTGVYDEDWNAGLSSIEAASYVSLSTAIAYTTPFFGAWLADAVLGDYWTIAIAGTTLYLPGLALMALTSVPHLLGESFNRSALCLSLFILWPAGAGSIKSVVNIFGAKQFHPLLQREAIESYYVHFYTSINVGALVGITFLPILAQWNVSVAYILPVILLSAAIGLFVYGSTDFVIGKPSHSGICGSTKAEGDIPLSKLFRTSLLIVPFCMAYSQMPTTLIVQGTVMQKAFGFLDAATINSIDALSVLFFGGWTGTYLYPMLSRRKIQLYTTQKFALGSFLATLSILWALFVEHLIRSTYETSQSRVSVLWQAPSYVLIGCGEIFAVSAAYEVAFTASSPKTKALASAINIFCVGGIPNILCVLLYHACGGWFHNSNGTANIAQVEDYVTAHVHKYFWVLVLILCFGTALNLAPPVQDFVHSLEKTAEDLIRTPMLTKKPKETTPLLKKQFLNGPSMYRANSIRAGPARSKLQKPIKSSYIHRLYKPMNHSKFKDLERHDSM